MLPVCPGVTGPESQLLRASNGTAEAQSFCRAETIHERSAAPMASLSYGLRRGSCFFLRLGVFKLTFSFFILFSLGFYTKKVPSLRVAAWLIPDGKLTRDTLRPAQPTPRVSPYRQDGLNEGIHDLHKPSTCERCRRGVRGVGPEGAVTQTVTCVRLASPTLSARETPLRQQTPVPCSGAVFSISDQGLSQQWPFLGRSQVPEPGFPSFKGPQAHEHTGYRSLTALCPQPGVETPPVLCKFHPKACGGWVLVTPSREGSRGSGGFRLGNRCGGGAHRCCVSGR